MAIRLLDPTPATPIDRLVDDYLNSCRARGLSPRTDEQYTYALRAVFLPWCADEGVERPTDLTRRTLDRFTSSLLQRRTASGQPLSKHSVHTYTCPVRLMITWAVREGEDIAAKPQLPRREKPVRDVLSRDEIDAMERALISERDKLIVRMFGDCGLRLDELTQLRRSDIVRSGRQTHVRVLGKRGRVRDVPIPPHVVRRLDRLTEAHGRDCSSDRLFVGVRRGPAGRYEPLAERGVYLVVKDAGRRAGLTKRIYPHLLRHSWMTEMLRRGMNPVQLSFIAGASPEVIQSCYAHLTKEDAYDAMLRALGDDGPPSHR